MVVIEGTYNGIELWMIIYFEGPHLIHKLYFRHICHIIALWVVIAIFILIYSSIILMSYSLIINYLPIIIANLAKLNCWLKSNVVLVGPILGKNIICLLLLWSIICKVW